MQKTCMQCGTLFEITSDDLAFYDNVSPIIAQKKYAIPPPTRCADCRQRRRLCFRNERCLYRRPCDLCSKDMISIYREGTEYTVYCQECWWSDRWDALSYGAPFDPALPFFEQFHELQVEVPRIALHVVNNENSEYVNLSGYNKNCYLIFAAEYDEDCMYGCQIIKSKRCIDTLCCFESEGCYEVIDCEKCYDIHFSRNCSNCHSSMFLRDCKGCRNCIFSTNLRNQEYIVMNEKVSAEEFERKKQEVLQQLNQGKRESLENMFDELNRKSIHRALEHLNTEDSTGNYLVNCKNCTHCFDLMYGQDCRNVFTGFHVKDLMDVCHTTDAELAYEVTSLGYNSYHTLFTNASWTGTNAQYCDVVHASSNVFGCVGLRNKKFCILNKQYTKGEYASIVSTIIGHMQKTLEWGEFFPVTLSPFAYNETLAHEYYPLKQDDIATLKWQWHDREESSSFKIIKQEQDFYQAHSLPSPLVHPDERHRRRMALRNPRKLWKRNCHKCRKEIQTTYAPDRPETVYCEKCYLEAVY